MEEKFNVKHFAHINLSFVNCFGLAKNEERVKSAILHASVITCRSDSKSADRLLNILLLLQLTTVACNMAANFGKKSDIKPLYSVG